MLFLFRLQKYTFFPNYHFFRIFALKKQHGDVMWKTLITLAFCLMIGSTGTINTNGKMNNYLCSKCGTLVKSASTPSSLSCRAGGSHRWNNLGEIGEENYCCKKCGINVESRRTPSSLGCPESGSHQWNHLGHMGNSTYQCKKCGLTINNDRTPSSLGCPQGSSHQWTKLTR